MWANTCATGYWWTGRPNFGDTLTPLLMARFAGLSMVWSPPAMARCIVVGSIIEHVPDDWAGVVAGAGQLFEGSDVTLPNATVLGVRGPLTAKSFPGQDLVLGDPGLLANELVSPVEKCYDLGVVPHWSDNELEHRPEFTRYQPRIIRSTGDPCETIREIGRCKKIVASSLHGIIVADAFGIPRRTEMTKLFAREGGSFKFRDYNASIGVRFVEGKLQAPDRFTINNRQAELFDMLEDLGRHLTGKTRGA